MKRPTAVPFALSLLALASGPALAQVPAGTLIHQFDGAVSGDLLGWSVANAGDLDHDGKDDILAGLQGKGFPGLIGAGQAIVYSGATGGVLRTIDGTTQFGHLGSSVSGLGDVNGDGTTDLLLGVPFVALVSVPAGRAEVHSGADGSLLYSVTSPTPLERFGDSVADLGDITGDGTSDFIVGGPGTTGAFAGVARVYSGATGQLLAEHFGGGAENLGRNVAGTPDADGDGTRDYLVTAPRYNASTKKFALGRIFLFSGATHATIRTYVGKKKLDQFGSAIAAMGDLDGDGLGDFVTAAPGVKKGKGELTGWNAAGQRIFRIKGGTTAATLASSLALAGDVDGDGLADLLIGVEEVNTFGGAVTLISGDTGLPLFLFTGLAGDDYGDAVASVGDLNGDGRPELVLGGWGASPGGLASAGQVRVYSVP